MRSRLAMRRHGVPEAILTDNGKVFTDRFGPGNGEVLFDRICRENGIRHLLTAPRSPTTTGKVERLHKTLRGRVPERQGVRRRSSTRRPSSMRGCATTTSNGRINRWGWSARGIGSSSPTTNQPPRAGRTAGGSGGSMPPSATRRVTARARSVSLRRTTRPGSG